MKSTAFHIRLLDEKCTGCRACEIACSFHHSQAFSPKIASLKIHRFDEDYKILITHYMKNKNSHLACDFCRGEVEPQCAKYCAPGAIIKV